MTGSYKQDLIKIPNASNGCRYLSKISEKIQPVKITKLVYNDDEHHTYDIEVADEHSFMCEGILVHNSAMNVLIDDDDSEMINAKLGNWRSTHPWRARSNNSVGLTRNNFSKETFNKLVELNQGDNDLGFVFMSHEDEIFNPCFTKNQRILTDNGWRTFEELVGTTPNIIQDNRVKGSVVDGKEVWDFDYDRVGTSTNTATKVVKTGENQAVYKLTTMCGREVEATENHHFATTKGMVELKDLKVGDKILIGLPEVYKANKQSYQYKLGLLYGLYYGDGTRSGNSTLIDIWLTNDESEDILRNIEELVSYVIGNTTCNLKLEANSHVNPVFKISLREKNYTKYRLTSCLLTQVFNQYNLHLDKQSIDDLRFLSKDLKSGFISGFLYTDGHVDYNENSKSLSLRIVQSNKEVLKTTNLILQELGVLSKVYNGSKSRNVQFKPGQKEYVSKESFRLVIPGVNNL
jgi:hypothetical protein